MINTIFHFVNDPTFDYQTAVNNGDISEYTIVFNSADHSIYCKGTMFGRMSRADMAEALGNISDLIPVATDSTLGGIKIGYTNDSDLNSRRYGVVLDSNNKAYVEVPWSDTITPDFDDTELKNLIATERGRIDNFISNLSATIDAKNRELYADGDWVREIFGNAQDPGSVAAAYRKELDDYLLLFDVWEYIDPEHPELGRKARIVELLNTEDGLTHRMGEAEINIHGAQVNISTLTHDLTGLTSTVIGISGDIDGCYKLVIINNPSNTSSAVNVDTISATIAALTSVTNNTKYNDDVFEVLPTDNVLYKNSVPLYFLFTKINGISERTSTLEQNLSGISLRVTDSETDIKNLKQKEASLEVKADSILSKVVDTENSINGCYKLLIVSNPANPSSAVNVNTISTKIASQDSVSNNTLYNDEKFETAPTAEVLYKNNVPQYFTFTRVIGLTVRASSLEQTASSITARVGAVENTLNGEGNVVGLVTRTSTIELTVDTISGRVGRVELREDSTDIALSNLELSVYKGLYVVEVVSESNSYTDISTISSKINALSEIKDGDVFKESDFTVLPTAGNIYKKGSTYFKLNKNDSLQESVASLGTSLTNYETTNDGNLGKIVTMAASVLDLKTSADAQGLLTSTADLASVITDGSFTGYSGLASKVSEIDGAYVSQASLTTQLLALDVSGQIATATSGFATETFVRTTAASEADDAESAAKGYADNIVASAKAEVFASIDDTVAGMTVLVTKDSNGVIDSGITLKADQVTIDANQTNFKNAVGAFVKTDVLEAGVADIKARLTVGGSDPAGSGTPGTITMKDASDGTIGIWDKDKLAVGTTSSPSSSNSAMLVNADGSGSAAKGNISWNANGDVSVNGTGQFNGVINASSGVFNGVVNATQFKAGSDEGFSITTSSDSLDFNYNGARLAFFSLRGWDSTNNQLADVADNPTGFYLYMTNPLNGHLITIDFTYLSFKDLNLNQVLRHEATFYSLSNLHGKAVETPVTLYYSLEDNTTKWWLHSDSATELTSSEMGTLYKKQQVNQRGVSYGACAQEVDAGIPYITTGYTLYELQTLQNNAPTKTGNYAMATHLNTDGSRSTDNWFVVPNSTTLLDSLNTNWNGVYRLDDGRVKSTTATTVKQSSNNYTVPTFTSAVSFISVIDENGNVESILYPAPSL